MSAGSGGWFIRARGRVLGPFTWSQLESLRDRGQLPPTHEVSQDRRSWIKAAELGGLYAPAGLGPNQPSTAAHTEWPSYSLTNVAGSVPVAQMGGPASWFVAQGETHQGPMNQAEVQRMLEQGELGSSSLVWTNGMADWMPAGQVPGLWPSSGGSSEAALAALSQSQSQFYPAPRTSGLAVASLILGLLWLCGLGSLLATIFGGMALRQIARSNGSLSGKGLALAGLILGILGLSVLFAGLLWAVLGPGSQGRWGF